MERHICSMSSDTLEAMEMVKRLSMDTSLAKADIKSCSVEVFTK